MGSTPYGPFTGVGSVMTTQALEPAFRMNVTNPDWWAVEDLTDRHGSFFSANGQWYFAANDRSHSTEYGARHVCGLTDAVSLCPCA
jgi:hypothetical protein